MRALLKLLAAMFHRRPRTLALPEPTVIEREPDQAAATLHVIPLPPPVVIADDVEGLTVRAPLSHEEAYEMHARYAPAFDQQAAVNRYVERHGDEIAASPDEVAVPQHDPPSFDQHRYANALQYADAFEQQLAAQRRRTQAYELAQPRGRIARGSYTPLQYKEPARQRSDQPSSATDFESRTIVGIPPRK